MKYKRIFLPIDINERLPDKTSWYIFRSLPDGSQIKRILFNPELDDKQWIFQHFYGVSEVEWLEYKQGYIVFTPEELKEFIFDCNVSYMTFDEFLKSKGYE